MSNRLRLIGVGMPVQEARLLALGAQQGTLTATGSTSQANSYALTESDGYFFTTVGANTGARLPDPGTNGMGQTGGPIFVNNGGSNALLLYPNTGGSINMGTTNASVSVPAGKNAYCIPMTNTWAVNVSA